MRGGSSFHRRRFLAGVPRSTSSGSVNLWIHRLRRTFSALSAQLLCADGAVVERLCFTSIFAAPLYRYLPYSYLYVLWLLRAAPPVVSALSVVSAPPVVSAVVCVVSGACGGVLAAGYFLGAFLQTQKIPGSEEPGIVGAPEGIRTPNLLIRSQMLYPLSYRRMFLASDFFNPSRQQVLLYGCPSGRASRKTRN